MTVRCIVGIRVIKMIVVIVYVDGIGDTVWFISFIFILFFFFSSRRRHTRCSRDWSSDVCSSDLVPVAILVPDKAVDGVGGVVEAVFGEAFLHLGFDPLQLADDPAVDVGKLDRRALVEAAVLARGVHQDEAGRVPQLVAEIAVALAAAQVEAERAREARARGEREAQRVGAERRDAADRKSTRLN